MKTKKIQLIVKMRFTRYQRNIASRCTKKYGFSRNNGYGDVIKTGILSMLQRRGLLSQSVITWRYRFSCSQEMNFTYNDIIKITHATFLSPIKFKLLEIYIKIIYLQAFELNTIYH